MFSLSDIQSQIFDGMNGKTKFKLHNEKADPQGNIVLINYK